MSSPLDEVLQALQALMEAQAQTPVPREAGQGNFRCERCEDCSHCRFCNDCNACEDCTYCDDCDGCSGCTHCKDCERCRETTHSRWSSGCSKSSYLTLCLDCEGCVQCFACVGLTGAEFCILNEKLPRKAYFSRVAALRAALEERVTTGWRPPWSEVEEEVWLDELDLHEAEAAVEAHDVDPRVREAVEQAWFEQRPLRVRYLSPEHVESERVVWLRQVVIDRAEILLNVDDVVRGPRQLKLHRLLAAEVVDEAACESSAS